MRSRTTRLLTATILLLAGGASMPFLTGTAAGRQTKEAPGVCHTETWLSRSAIDPLVGPYDDLLRTRVVRAVTLFRFARVQDALRKLDTAVDVVTRIVDSRVSAEQRKAAITRIQNLRACLKAAPVPAVATIIVRPLSSTDDEGRKLDERPIAGAYVEVDDLPVGETGKDGTLRVRVPSGAITVTVVIPPSSAGARELTLAAGSSSTIRIPLHDVEQVGGDGLMMLAEAVEDVVPAGSPSLTFRFVTDDGPVKVASIDDVELFDPDGNFGADLTDVFAIKDPYGVTALDAPSLLKTLGRDGRAVTIRVMAGDVAGFAHSGKITFRIR
jgi:hypothetical protein